MGLGRALVFITGDSLENREPRRREELMRLLSSPPSEIWVIQKLTLRQNSNLTGESGFSGSGIPAEGPSADLADAGEFLRFDFALSSAGPG